jgi:hypothetical protein
MVICVPQTAHPKLFRDLNKQSSVVDINNLPGRHLSNVQSQLENGRVGLAEMDKARGNKRIHEPGQLNPTLPTG